LHALDADRKRLKPVDELGCGAHRRRQKRLLGGSAAGSGLLRDGDVGHRTAPQKVARTTGASPL